MTEQRIDIEELRSSFIHVLRFIKTHKDPEISAVFTNTETDGLENVILVLDKLNYILLTKYNADYIEVIRK